MRKLILIILVSLIAVSGYGQINWTPGVGAWQLKDTVGGKNVRFRANTGVLTNLVTTPVIKDSLSNYTNKDYINIGAYKNNPSLVGSFTYAGANLHAKATVNNGYLFVCEYLNDKIAVFDLSDQESPILIQEISTGSGSNPRDVEVILDRYLVVACNTSAEIKVYDISNPKSATLITTISTGSGSKDFVFVGKYMYLVCNGIDKVQKWDFTDILNPFLVSDLTTSSSPLSIDYSNGLLAVVGLSEFLDIIPLSLGLKLTTNITGNTHGTVKFFGNYILATDTDRDLLQIINIENAVSPTIVNEVPSSANPEEINIVGNYAYVPSLTDPPTNGKLDVFDLTNIADGYKLKTVELNNQGSGFCAVSGEYIYVTGHFSPYTIDVVKIPAKIVNDGRIDLNRKGLSDTYLFNEISNYSFGNAEIGEWSINDSFARFGHKGLNTSGNYGFLQQANGDVFIKGSATKLVGNIPLQILPIQYVLSKDSITNSITQFKIFDYYVSKQGNQNIDGIKTFLEPVVGVDPTDYNHFTTKQYVDSVSAGGGATYTFLSPILNISDTISIPSATGIRNGYLTSTDWTTFNNKAAATGGTGYIQNGTGLQSSSNFYISGTGRATNFGAGISPNANFGFTGSASTSTTTPFLITPGVAYTGTQNGALWYETTNSRLKIYRSSQADDFIFNRANSLYASTGTRIAMFNNTGDLSATVEYKEIVNISSSASTLSLTNAGFYKFTGTTTTWTLPQIAGNSGNKITIINRGSGNITLNSNSGANDIDESMIFMSTTTVATTEIIALYNDGSKWIILP